jgi:predicted RNA polymerase sigma factor
VARYAVLLYAPVREEETTPSPDALDARDRHAKGAPTYAETDWPQIVRLYDTLLPLWPSPVVALSRAVAGSMTSGPGEALVQVEPLGAEGRRAGYHYLPRSRRTC